MRRAAYQVLAFLGALAALVGGVVMVLLRRPAPSRPVPRRRDQEESQEARRVERLDAEALAAHNDARNASEPTDEIERARRASELEG